MSSAGKKIAPLVPLEKIKGGKIPAGFLLESAGVCGMRKGGIIVAPHHGNLIINQGNGKARDARALIETIKQKVKKHYGITLEEEVRYLGF